MTYILLPIEREACLDDIIHDVDLLLAGDVHRDEAAKRASARRSGQRTRRQSARGGNAGAHLRPAQGIFGKVMLMLTRMRSPRVVSTYRWSVVTGVR